MATSLTLDNLDGDVVERLRDEARRRGVDISIVVNEILKAGLAPPPRDAGPYRDLDHLAGTWSQADADAFLAAVADLERLDNDLWK